METSRGRNECLNDWLLSLRSKRYTRAQRSFVDDQGMQPTSAGIFFSTFCFAFGPALPVGRSSSW